MQYLGGKSRLAKAVASIIAPRGPWWEPFCGGLSVSVQLAKYGPGTVSDVNPALIALYRAVRDGWTPPTSVSEAEYQAAKLLPDSDPLKAFVGFGCSFGGKWFGGYSKEATVTKANGQSWFRCAAKQTAKTLARDIPAIAHCTLEARSFFGDAPDVECLYSDPPYRGTTGYDGVGSFDHQAFWPRCAELARGGLRVFVSEYACPVPHEVVMEVAHDVTVKGKTEKGSRVERLFRVLP